MSDNDNEKAIAVMIANTLALERIAVSLEMMVQKPAWVKTAEKVLDTANTVAEETPKVEKKKTDSEKQKPISSTAKEALLGQTVKVTDGDPKHAGKTGVVTKVMRAWVYVQTDTEDQISLRPMHLEVISDESATQDEKEEVTELNTEISETDESTEPTEAEIVEVGPEPSDKPNDAGNYICTAGKHEGKTIHSLYQESVMGTKTVKWMARSGTNEEQQKAAQAYLESIGEGWLER